MKNKQGYDITFKCSMCNKEFMLEDMHYFEYDNTHMCNKCFKKFRKIPNKVRAEELGIDLTVGRVTI